MTYRTAALTVASYKLAFQNRATLCQIWWCSNMFLVLARLLSDPDGYLHCRRAILPVAADFAETGVLASTILCFVVALANAYTTDLLLWQAHATACHEYELVALAVGGRWWKVLAGLGPADMVLLVRKLRQPAQPLWSSALGVPHS